MNTIKFPAYIDKRLEQYFEALKYQYRSDTDREALLGDSGYDWEEDNLFLVALAMKILEIARESESLQK